MYQSRVKGQEIALLLELSLLGKRLWQGQIKTEAMCITGAYQLPLDMFVCMDVYVQMYNVKHIYTQQWEKTHKVDCHGTKKQTCVGRR